MPTGTAAVPYVWVVGETREAFEDVLADASELQGYTTVDELDERALYRVDWRRDADSVVRVLVDHDAVLLEAGGDAESWQFQVRFPDSDVLSHFHDACRRTGVALDVDRLYDRVEGPRDSHVDLTDAQHSLLERAFDAGYFDVPRQTTLKELSDQLDISDQAANERLRRGLQAVLAAIVKSAGRRATDGGRPLIPPDRRVRRGDGSTNRSNGTAAGVGGEWPAAAASTLTVTWFR